MKDLIEHLSNNQDIVYMGIVGADVTTSISEQENIPIGVYVSEVSLDSPAITAGIQPGDIIHGDQWSGNCKSEGYRGHIAEVFQWTDCGCAL